MDGARDQGDRREPETRLRPLDPRLLARARATRGYALATVVLGAAVAGLLVAQAALLATAITAVFMGGADRADLGRTLKWLAAVIVARAAIAWGQEVAAQRSAQAAKGQLREALFAKVTELGPSWLDRERGGELATLATRGVDALDAYFARYLPQLVLAVVAPLVVLALILPSDLIAGITIAVTLPLIPIFMILIGLTTQQRTGRQFRLLARLSHHFLDLVAGLPTLKVFGRAKAQARAIEEVTADYRHATMSTLRLSFLSALALELLATISVALVAVGIGLRLVNGSLDLRTALFVLILAPEAYLPLRQLGANFHASAEGLSAAGRVLDVLAVEPSRHGGRPLPGPVRAVRWAGVTVRYEGRPAPALAGLSLRAAIGEIVALTGVSGSGKSTALAAALGFVTPSAGRVVVECESAGAPTETSVADLDPPLWLDAATWLSQRPHLVAGSVAENVRLGRPDATDAAVADALAAAGAADFVARLPEGAGTAIGAGGRRLSAGQTQRLALARALLRTGPVLFLDEPTGGLDAETERHVIEALRRHAHDRVVVIAAHRPSLVALADRVVNLQTPRPAEPTPVSTAGP